MPNGINQELDFESKIAGMQDRQLLEFVARQNYETCIRCESHNQRIIILEEGSRKSSSITGGITGTIAGIIIGIISYFTNKN